jgi:hypothetical protein
MSKAEKDPIRELLRRQTNALSKKVEGGESVSADELAEVGRTLRLIEFRDAAAPPRRNWWAAGVLAATLAILSVLLFVRVSETEVELDLTISGVRFSLSRDQVIAGAMRVARLGISGLRDLQLPAEAAPGAQPGPSAIRISANGLAKPPGVATLAPLTLTSGATIGLEPVGEPHEYSLSLKAPAIEMRVDIDGSVDLALAGSPPRHLDLRSPRPILLRAGPNDVSLDLSFSAATPTPFQPQLAVKDLALFRIDEYADGDRTLVRRVSTVLSGTLFLESLNDEKHLIRPGEALEFEKSDGEFRELRLEDNRIGLRYHGSVRGMTTGSGEARRSLMPTYLEWLRARHGLSLLWAATLYIFGLAAGALRWWGVRL